MKMDPEALYHQLGHLMATMPDLSDRSDNSAETRQWLGRACALVDASGDVSDAIKLRVACDSLGATLYGSSANQITTLVHRAFARAELAAPATARGTFIPVGESFSALSAVSSVLRSASTSVLMVDPYADGNLLTDFAVQAPESISVQVLADAATHKPGLKPAAERWTQQFGSMRPLEVRLAAPRSLHDRLILVDSRDAYTLGQSFNALANRAHTTIGRTDPDTAKLKIDAYNDIWGNATPLL